MKRSLLILSSVIAYFLFSAVSCEDPEPFVTIKPVESQVYQHIKIFREANGKTGAFVELYPMAGEAQIFSLTKRYAGATTLDTAGISEHWDIIHEKYGGYNDLTLLQITTDNSAADIAANWTEDTAFNELLLGDFSQCGVGIEFDDNQVYYVTLMLMKID
jgi:hypothetical protein